MQSQVQRSWIPGSQGDKFPLKDLEGHDIRIISEKFPSETTMEEVAWIVLSAFIRDDVLKSDASISKFATEERIVGHYKSLCPQIIPDVAIAAQILPPDRREECCYYNSLPLPAPTGLPINLHGAFATSSDRRSMRIDGDSGAWNRFLAGSCLPHLYFLFLEEIAAQAPEGYYAYWPTIKQTGSNLSHVLQSSFWLNIRYCPRGLILNNTKDPFPLSQTIFDIRPSSDSTHDNNDPVLEVVRALRPNSIVISQPALSDYLLHPDGNPDKPETTGVDTLRASFVRELLHEPLVKEVIPRLQTVDVKSIIDFVLEGGPMETLLDCYILRTVNGDTAKMESFRGPECKIIYVSNDEGCRLFGDLAGDSLIEPSILPPDIANKWIPDDNINIRRLCGSAVDEFVSKWVPSQYIKSFSTSEKAWISDVWKYVSDEKLSISFYKTIPTIRLENEESKFVSAEAFKTLPVMSSRLPSHLRHICSRLKGILILAETTFEPLEEITSDWDHNERFVQCLYRLVHGDGRRLQELILEQSRTIDLKVRPNYNFP